MVRSKLKVTAWVRHSVDSQPFLFMSMGHPIPELRLFQKLTLKIKGEGHGWGQNSKSECWSNILSTHIPFVQCQSVILFLSNILKKLTLKIRAHCHWWGHISKSQHGSNIPSTHIPFMSICHPIPELRLFQNLTLKIKGQDHVTVQSHNVGLISYRRTSISLHVIRLPIPEIQHFQNLSLKIQVQGQMTMMNRCRSRQFHIISNGINPTSGFRDMVSAKSGPSATWFDKFLAHG